MGDESLRETRKALAQVSPKVLLAVAEACITAERASGLGSPSFAAAVDLIALGTLSDDLSPEVLITPYIHSVRSGDYSLSAAGVATTGAAALVRLARRATPERWREFLSPLDLHSLLARGDEPGANRFAVGTAVARSIRAHVRILSRAIVSWDGVPPPELINALLSAVRSSATAHEEEGALAAFSAQYETGRYDPCSERPMAADLGEALVCLDKWNRDQLLSAILETREPLMLAQLVTVAPHSTRARIRDRISALTPANAGELSSLTSVHARIEALLDVGAADAAAHFIAVERDLKTLGRVPGRELAQLRMNMRLWLLRGDFANIATAELPGQIQEGEKAEAVGVIAFYKALAELRRPGGDLDAAERGFRALYESRHEVPAYGTNLLATRLTRLLEGNLFGRVPRALLTNARQALADAESAMDRWIGAGDDDLGAHNCNRALLLLAVGQPERAHEVLESTPPSKLQERIASYSAVALARMGRGTDASKAIAAASALFGESDDVRSARAQIQRGTPLDERATTITADDPVGRIKAALLDLCQMDAVRQAEVLHGSQGGFDELVASHIRSAAASVVALVPMMKDVKLDSCEDDLTALLQAILAARLEFFGWSLADQSKGGFTDKGNAGERDLVLRKGGAIVSVIEAVVCDRPASHEWTKKELASHFQKLLGYSTCRIFFHLTYCYVSAPADVLDLLRRSAQEDCPTGFSFTRLDDIPLTDSRPTGFWASYATSLGEVKVAFLLLDMGQAAQRDAAHAAASRNPRRKKDRD